jgi:diguanylate cyclase
MPLDRAQLVAEIERAVSAAPDTRGLSAVMVITIPQFRDFTIELGHHGAEAIINEICNRIAGCLREADCLGRLSSADLCLLLPQLRTQGQAIMAINKIQRVCQEPLLIEGKSVRPRLVFGAALAPTDATTANEVIGCAETALRHALGQRRESVFFGELKQSDVLPVLGLERSFSAALDRNELSSVYQPIIDVETGDVVAAEMIAHWEDSRYGVISPATFFKIAEDSGLMTPLALWAINKGLRECADWQPQLPDLAVSVNIPSSVLCEPHLSASLLDALRVWDMRPDQLTIEITEKSLVLDPDAALQVLNAMHAQGVKIAIDDFGTGYSSLAYLKKLPVSGLKIDSSFVKNMLDNPADRRIVKSVIDLAHNFELVVVADGVEDEETLDSLMLMGCHRAQGTLIGAPMAPLSLTAWLQASPWTLNGERYPPSTVSLKHA